MQQAAPAVMFPPGGLNEPGFSRSDTIDLLQTVGLFGDDKQGLGSKAATRRPAIWGPIPAMAPEPRRRRMPSADVGGAISWC